MNFKNAIKFSLFILLLNPFNNLLAQDINYDILGKWKIKDWLFFERLNETADEHSTRMSDYHKCLKGYISIDTSGIHVPDYICGLESCNGKFLRDKKYLIKTIVKDNGYTLSGEGSEMIDSDIVGESFVKKIDTKYSKKSLVLLDTECLQSYGDFTMKICLINKNKIGFFLGEELIILERS